MSLEPEQQEKMMKKKKFKNGCGKNKISSTGLFSILNVCGLDFAKKKPTKLLLAQREAWCRKKLNKKRMKGCKKKNMLSFYWCREKFGEFILGKVELRKKRAIITIKQEEEEEGE